MRMLCSDRSRFKWRCKRLGFSYVFLFLGLVFTLLNTSSAAEVPAGIERMTQILDGLKQQLGIPQTIILQLVDTNTRAFSVQPDTHGAFLVKIDAHFLLHLDDEETKAAMAHELGHVWIYTHHPFLHTEALANEIAVRVVSRQALQKLYSKVWQFETSIAD